MKDLKLGDTIYIVQDCEEGWGTTVGFKTIAGDLTLFIKSAEVKSLISSTNEWQNNTPVVATYNGWRALGKGDILLDKQKFPEKVFRTHEEAMGYIREIGIQFSEQRTKELLDEDLAQYEAGKPWVKYF